MTTVVRITSIHELVRLWPRIVKLIKKDTPKVEVDDLLTMFMLCIRTGAVFAIRGDSGLLGTACVSNGDGGVLTLCSIPNDNGQGLNRVSMNAIKDWATEHGYVAIKATTTRFNGSSFRYFEKSLGFKRHSVTFAISLNEEEKDKVCHSKARQ